MASLAFPCAATCRDLAHAMRVFWRSPQLISRRTQIPLRLQLSHRDTADGDDSVRLHMVALACEILVLVRLIEQELPANTVEPFAQEIRASCWEHRSAAERLLSVTGAAPQASVRELPEAIVGAYKRLGDVRRLRDRVKAMRTRRTATRSRRANALSACLS